MGYDEKMDKKEYSDEGMNKTKSGRQSVAEKGVGWDGGIKVIIDARNIGFLSERTTKKGRMEECRRSCSRERSQKKRNWRVTSTEKVGKGRS